MTNIAIVVLDTLRKDSFDEHFNWMSGTRFENAWAPSHWTVPVHGSLFTGQYPSETGIHSKSPTFRSDYPLIPEVLNEAGYATRAFSANPNLSPEFNFGHQFDEFEGSWRLKTFKEDILNWPAYVTDSNRSGIPAYIEALVHLLASEHQILPSLKLAIRLKSRSSKIPLFSQDEGVKTATKKVRKTEIGEDEFYFINLMEAHRPYTAPGRHHVSYESYDPLSATVGNDEPDVDVLRSAYDGCVEYLSEQYRTLFSELQSDFDYIITMSDHGEAFGEHGIWEHFHGIPPEIVHVPLVVSGPGLDGTVSKPVSLLDVHQTIASLAEVDVESRGQDLLRESIKDRPLLIESHGLRDTWLTTLRNMKGEKVAEQFNQPMYGIAAPESYYGFENTDGWGERGNASIESPKQTLEELKKDRIRNGDPHSAKPDLSEGVEDQLEQLGYK